MSLASLAAQVTFRYPNLRILEVPNTKEPLPSVSCTLVDSSLSYTILLPLESPVEEAKKKLTRHELIEFKSVNLQLDRLPSEISPHQYGMAIVSGLRHDTNSIMTTLRNLRTLLQPGGHLLIGHTLDQGPLSAEGLASHLSVSQFGLLAQQAGFSQVDSIRNIDETSVMAVQAVDYRVHALRNALKSDWTTMAKKKTYIIVGAISEMASPLVHNTFHLLQRQFEGVVLINGIDSLEIENIPPTAAIISLVDLHEPIFKSMNAGKLKGLKELLKHSRSILWVPRGSRAEDPYANMTVGFGRTLLLETSYLQLQFLDIDPMFPLTAEKLAEVFLRLLSFHEWSCENGDKGYMIWTTEPELALDKNGTLMIPRVVPSRERNDRYNSDRREILSELDSKSEVFGPEFLEASSSYVLRHLYDPTYTQNADDHGLEDIVTCYSTVLALKIYGAGYLYLILGRIAPTGRKVLALSVTNASRVRVPREWCVSCPERMTAQEEPTFLSSAAWSFYAYAILSCYQTGDVMLVYDPPSALEVALSRIADSRHINIYFLSISSHPDMSKYQGHCRWLMIHADSSETTIKSCLPASVSVFLSSRPLSAHDKTFSRIASCLPSSCRRIESSFLCSREGSLSPVQTTTEVHEQLHRIASAANCSSHRDTIMLDVGSIAKSPLIQELTLINWTAATVVTAKLEPVDVKLVFAPDRTYFLAGLAGELGQSLTEWMVDHGARYVVLTSRNPRIDDAWLKRFEKTGVTIRIIPK